MNSFPAQQDRPTPYANVGDRFQHNSLPNLIVTVTEITEIHSDGYRWVLVKSTDGGMWPERVIDLDIGYRRLEPENG